MYNRICQTRLIRLTKRNTYRLFFATGKLFLNFLKDEQNKRTPVVTTKSPQEDVTEQKNEQVQIEHEAKKLPRTPPPAGVNRPEDVMAWMVGRRDAEGRILSESMAERYVQTLQQVPQKLQIPIELDQWSVLEQHSARSVGLYWGVFKAAPNYEQLDRETHGMLSLSLGCFIQYLEGLPERKKAQNVVNSIVPQEGSAMGTSASAKEDPIWSGEIKASFEQWLQRERYSRTVINNATKALAQVFNSRSPIFTEECVVTSSTNLEAVRRIYEQAQKDPGFQSRYHLHQYSVKSALRLFESYWSRSQHIASAVNPSGSLVKKSTRAMMPIKQTETKTESAPMGSQNEGTEGFFVVDFDHPETCTGTSFRSCTICGEEIVPQRTNWTHAFVAIVEWLLQQGDPELSSLDRTKIIGAKPFFLYERPRLAAKKLSNGKWIYTNYNAPSLVSGIKKLWAHCHRNVNDVVIIACSLEENMLPAQLTQRYARETETGTIDVPKMNDAEKERTIQTIARRFKNGFRVSSNIDFERFCSYYVETYGEKFQYEENQFNELLHAEALIYDDRAYVYDEDMICTVRCYIKEIGAPCIYADMLFEKYSNEFYMGNIFSVEMLRAFIVKYYRDIYCKRSYIYLNEHESPSDLVRQVFDEREAWSLEALQERLPFLKVETIRQALNQPGYFCVAKGTYTHIDNMDLPSDEGEKIVDFVETRLEERQYVAVKELDLSRLELLNPNCSFSAVGDAVFYKFLAKKYVKQGQVITKTRENFNVLNILERHCREKKTVSLEELQELESRFDLTGKSNRLSLIAGNNTMIRVSQELFVSEEEVDFDTNRIDEAIDLYCHDDFIPIRRITDFSLFPYTKYVWNGFLLESFVRRFSKKYKFDARSPSNSSLGVIARRDFEYGEYDDLLAIALAKSSLSLRDKAEIGDYLVDNGYIGRRRIGKNDDEIIKKANVLREGNWH